MKIYDILCQIPNQSNIYIFCRNPFFSLIFPKSFHNAIQRQIWWFDNADATHKCHWNRIGMWKNPFHPFESRRSGNNRTHCCWRVLLIIAKMFFITIYWTGFSVLIPAEKFRGFFIFILTWFLLWDDRKITGFSFMKEMIF